MFKEPINVFVYLLKICLSMLHKTMHCEKTIRVDAKLVVVYLVSFYLKFSKILELHQILKNMINLEKYISGSY